MSQLSADKVIEDIDFIKKIILAPKDKAFISVKSLETHIRLNFISLFGVLCLVLWETTTGVITNDLLASQSNPILQRDGLWNVGLFLIGIVVAYLWLIGKKAKTENQTLHTFASNHFIYYRNFSILADLTLKFSIFALIILSEHPEWIAGLLLMYTGDLIVHGRHFYLPLLQSYCSGIICFITGISMLVMGAPHMIVPLIFFGSVNILSLFNLRALKQKMTQGEDA